MKSVIFTSVFIILSFAAISQDKILKANGDSIRCKVTEIGATQVKYHYSENPELTFGIDKTLIDKIYFKTGEVVNIEKNSMNNAEYYANQHKHALKLNFISPLMGSTEFVFEKSIKPGRSWETALGIIGLGGDPQEYNPAGVFGKFAYKFIRDPDFYMQSMHYSHILKGSYIAPEIGLRYMSYDTYDYSYTNTGYYSTYNETKIRADRFDVALLLKFGKQWVFDDGFLVDTHVGIGYGIGGDDYEEALNYGFIVGSGSFPIAFTGGIRVGWVFGK